VLKCRADALRAPTQLAALCGDLHPTIDCNRTLKIVELFADEAPTRQTLICTPVNAMHIA
jgi:hypothetical protein